MDKEEINEEVFTPRVNLTALNAAVEKLRAEVGKIIVGQQRMVDLIITGLLCNGHILIEGVPGIAKTLTAKLVARSLSVDFSRIQFTPDLMPSDVTGTSVFNPKTVDFTFKPGPVFSNFVLIDEINRSPAKTQAALFEVMEEQQVTVDGTTYPMKKPFLVIATQNPIEQEGTYRLPEAQLDRFLMKINVQYPDPDEELLILKGHHTRGNNNNPELINAVLTAGEITEYQQVVQKIHVEENLMKYIVAIIAKTREDSSIYLGASPRASVSVLSAAKAMAAISGRDFVTPEDIKEIAEPVLCHRIILTPEKEMEGFTAEQVLKDIIKKIEIPR